MEEKIMLFLFLITLPLAKGAMPGTFFWKPRLSLDLAVPTTPNTTVYDPNRDNIAKGVVVMLDGYSVGMTVAALAMGLSGSVTNYEHLNPISGYFYTNAYRWALRYLSLLPRWFSGQSGSYVDTHRTWTRRFYFMNSFIPNWMKKFLPFVKKKEWDKEEEEFKKYTKYADPVFRKYFRFPFKNFTDFKSHEVGETDESYSSEETDSG